MPDAKVEWERLAPELERLGLLTVADLGCFSIYCQSFARWQAAESDLEARGLIQRTPNGYETPQPAVAISREAIKTMLEAGARLGLTPSDRRRMALPVEAKTPRSGLLDAHKGA